ncbi:hypothetical protein [Shinella sumterensis]|uniref:Uncharacterized protein n=1 Tax=Shinella sumterensis TaxID=1967501 RepID=A0AA50H857_9HYPH|nr:hypothetical protein [Shinella sumterensis]WLR98747.1 hypothetical protein Q9313_06920 [Shinella sumterensis]
MSNTIAARQARGVVYMGLAFLTHCMIWSAIPAAFALAMSFALILVERLAGEMADTIIDAVMSREEATREPSPRVGFRSSLKFELFGPVASIVLATLAAVAGRALKPWLAPALQWLGA